jgi:hypothetical protein
MWLFFLQSLTDLVESVYSFGLLSTGVTLEAVGALFLLSPLLLWLVPGRPPASTIPFLVLVAVGCRLSYPLVDPGSKTLLAGLSVSAFLLLFPLLIAASERRLANSMGSSLSLGLATLVSFRVLGSGTDLSTLGLSQALAWPLGIPTILTLARQQVVATVLRGPSAATTLRGLVPATGLMACFALVVSVFSTPNVVSRWNGADYELLVVAFFAGLLIYSLLLPRPPRFVHDVRFLLLGQAALVSFLLLTVLPQQIDFPSNVDAYPFHVEPLPSWRTAPALVLMLLAPVAVHASFFFAQQMATMRPSASRWEQCCSRSVSLLRS